MTENPHLQRAIRDFVKQEKIQSGQMVYQGGYVSVCFSPAATNAQEASDKLAICCSYREWVAIGQILELWHSKDPLLTVDSQALDFLRGAIKNVPAPFASGGLLKQEDFSAEDFDNLDTKTCFEEH